MTATRRNVLTILGLAAASSPALATDDMANTMFDPNYRLQKYDPERMARALERLAAEVRLGKNATHGRGVSIARFHIGSELCGDDFLRQTLTIDLEIVGHGES